MADLSIVIVSWNVRSHLCRCLESILGAERRQNSNARLEIQVIVVDNGSEDGSAMMVREGFPDVQLVANHDNRGFPAANNQGMALADGRYILFLNPDTEVVGDALSELVTFADEHGDVGMLGPQLVNPDGTVQSSRRRFPTLATAFLESTWLQPAVVDAPSRGLASILTKPLQRVLRRYYLSDRRDDIAQDVDWITGAAMMARREAIDDAGLMDEGFFMYSEELDWCRRFREAGWRVVYFPSARIVHHVGKSSEQVVAARHVHFQTSKVRYFRKYHGALAAEVLRWYLMATYAWQLAVEGAKWLVGHKRALRAQRVTAYRQVLASGLRSPS
ncbi:MAG: glycosyltransferase family 2 protein [Anaerolineae bacterium]|jgi:GT2 family glycosyltransferase